MSDQEASPHIARMWKIGQEDQAPSQPPHVITIDWTVGDSLNVDYGDLAIWEVCAALQGAIDLLRDEDKEEDA